MKIIFKLGFNCEASFTCTLYLLRLFIKKVQLLAGVNNLLVCQEQQKT